jgi:xylitol oxidase
MPAVRGRVSNWANNVTFEAATVHRPESVDELRRLVGASPRIRALGSGHSFSLVAQSTGELVRLDALPAKVDIDGPGRVVTVAAGMRYADVAVPLQQAGFALANLASLPTISVGGSCATGTHGSGNDQRSLAAAVRRLRLIGPTGDIHDLDWDADPETFPGAVVALGALGIVTELTLEIERTYEVSQRVVLDVPLTEVAERWTETFGAAYSVSAFTDYAGGTANIWLKNRTDQPDPGWSGSGHPADGPVHPVPGVPAQWCTTQLGIAGPWHERLPHFRADYMPVAGQELQSEYLVSRDVAPAALTALCGIGHLVAPVLHIAELRTVRADHLWLSPAYGRDTAAFHFTWIHDLRAVSPVMAAVEELLLPLGARPHWAKLTTADPTPGG